MFRLKKKKKYILPFPKLLDWVLLAQDVFELVGRADREQQCPRQQGVGVELARLETDGRTGAVCPRVGPGEKVLKALHGSMHVLEQEAEGGLLRTGVCNAKIKNG